MRTQHRLLTLALVGASLGMLVITTPAAHAGSRSTRAVIAGALIGGTLGYIASSSRSTQVHVGVGCSIPVYVGPSVTYHYAPVAYHPPPVVYYSAPIAYHPPRVVYSQPTVISTRTACSPSGTVQVRSFRPAGSGAARYYQPRRGQVNHRSGRAPRRR